MGMGAGEVEQAQGRQLQCMRMTPKLRILVIRSMRQEIPRASKAGLHMQIECLTQAAMST
jgi:hypothetical protein